MEAIAGGGIYLALMVLALVVLVLWILLPFAVFGIKQKLDRMIELLEESNNRIKLASPNQQEPTMNMDGGGHYVGKKKYVDKYGKEFDVG